MCGRQGFRVACRVAVISDIHYTASRSHPKRRGELGRQLLTRVIERLNEELHPDLVVLLGDLVDVPDGEETLERLRELRATLEGLKAPALVLPGNHDPLPERFYEVMPRPAGTVDVAGVRFVSFVDKEEPGWNASRSQEDLARMQDLRRGHTGPLVALQHVPVLPRGATDCPYTYTNLDDILRLTEEQEITLSIGGHHHPGTPLVRRGKNAFLCVKALGEAPFVFTMVEVGDEIAVQEFTTE